MKRVPMLLALFLATSAPKAESGSVIQDLMAEPVSMFDWGMVNLRNELKAVLNVRGAQIEGEHYKWVSPSAIYLESENRILVHVWSGSHPSRKAALKWAEETTNILQDEFFLPAESPLMYWKTFGHEGLGSRGLPEDTWSRLARITSFEVSARLFDRNTTVTCESSFEDRTPSCSWSQRDQP